MTGIDLDQIVVRFAAVADAPKLLELERALIEDGRGVVNDTSTIPTLHDEQRRIDDMYRLMSNGFASVHLVAELEQQIAGSARLVQLLPALCCHVGVLSLAVHPHVQRRGIGRALLRALVDHADQGGLERLELYVRADNERAIALYISEGFEQEGVRRRFVKLADGSYVDDLVMVRFLR